MDMEKLRKVMMILLVFSVIYSIVVYASPSYIVEIAKFIVGLFCGISIAITYLKDSTS